MSFWDKDYGGTQARNCEIRTDPWIEVARRDLQFPNCPEQRRFLFHPDSQNAYGVWSYIFRPLRNLRTHTYYILYSAICSRKWSVKICWNIFFELRSSFPFGNRTVNFVNQINPNLELLLNMRGAFLQNVGILGPKTVYSKEILFTGVKKGSRQLARQEFQTRAWVDSLVPSNLSQMSCL